MVGPTTPRLSSEEDYDAFWASPDEQEQGVPAATVEEKGTTPMVGICYAMQNLSIGSEQSNSSQSCSVTSSQPCSSKKIAYKLEQSQAAKLPNIQNLSSILLSRCPRLSNDVIYNFLQKSQNSAEIVSLSQVNASRLPPFASLTKAHIAKCPRFTNEALNSLDKNISSLFLYENNITFVPNIDQFTKLRKITFTSLQAIDDSFFSEITHLPSLRTLAIPADDIERLPPLELSELTLCGPSLIHRTVDLRERVRSLMPHLHHAEKVSSRLNTRFNGTFVPPKETFFYTSLIPDLWNIVLGYLDFISFLKLRMCDSGIRKIAVTTFHPDLFTGQRPPDSQQTLILKNVRAAFPPLSSVKNLRLLRCFDQAYPSSDPSIPRHLGAGDQSRLEKFLIKNKSLETIEIFQGPNFSLPLEKNLTKLHLLNCPVTAKALSSLIQCTQLSSLRLTETNAGAVPLPIIPNLETVEFIPAMPIDSAFFTALLQLPRLKELTLAAYKSNVQMLRPIPSLTHLKFVKMGCDLDEAEFKILANTFPHLHLNHDFMRLDPSVYHFTGESTDHFSEICSEPTELPASTSASSSASVSAISSRNSYFVPDEARYPYPHMNPLLRTGASGSSTKQESSCCTIC